MSSKTRALALLLIGIPAAIPAAESSRDNGTIEIALGETVYFQLLDSMSIKPGPAVRVENPNRDYLVVKATLEVGEGGTRRLSIRNGYDGSLGFSMNAACPPDNKPGLVHFLSPPAAVLQLPASVTKVVLCGFSIASRP